MDLPFKCESTCLQNKAAKFNGVMFLYLEMQAVKADDWNVDNDAGDVVNLEERMKAL